MEKDDFKRLKGSVRQMVDVENRIVGGGDIFSIDDIVVLDADFREALAEFARETGKDTPSRKR